MNKKHYLTVRLTYDLDSEGMPIVDSVRVTKDTVGYDVAFIVTEVDTQLAVVDTDEAKWEINLEVVKL